MSYDFRFWQTLRNPSSLTFLLEKEEERYKLQGYKKAVLTLLFASIVLFALRDSWGMYTFRLTEIIGQGQLDRFIFARYLSIIGACVLGLLFFIFHYYVIAYILSLITDLPFKWIQKVQVYVLTFILGFKLIEFIFFAIAKFTPIYSPFSFAAIFAQFTTDPWTLYFINQLSLVTFITITIQYIFLVHWDAEAKRELLLKIIAVQILVAAAIATISIFPLVEWLGKGLS